MYTIHAMNINRMNLNLLTSLDALLTEENVSKAANKLYITQAAMSNSLNRLREALDDELLIRSGRKMILTSKAAQLAPKIHNLLEQLNTTLFHADKFEPKASEREFVIGMSDYMECIVLPSFMLYLQEHAPGIKIKIVHLTQVLGQELFTSNTLDLFVGLPLNHDISQLRSEALFTDSVVCVANKKHKLVHGKRMNMTDFLAAKHLSIAPQGEYRLTKVDQALTALNLQRDVVLTVPHTLPALQVVSTSQLLTIIPSRIAALYAGSYKVNLYKVPFSIPSVSFMQIWHAQMDNDPAHAWLRQALKNSQK